MTETESNLYQAILADPKDDLRREAFVDCLMEDDSTVECECKKVWPSDSPCQYCNNTGLRSNGKADYAEFIKIQLELDKRSCSGFMMSCNEYTHYRCGCSDFGGHYGQQFNREKKLWIRWWSKWYGRNGNIVKSIPETVMGFWAYAKDKGPGVSAHVLVSPTRYRTSPVQLYSRRGFVSEAYCTLPLFLGPPCLFCIGTGRTESRDEWGYPILHCGFCDGIGFRGGLAEHLTLYPIEYVDIRRNLEALGTNHYTATFERNQQLAGTLNYLPNVLFDKLKNGYSSDGNRITYHDPLLARDALSEVLVARVNQLRQNKTSCTV